MKSRLPGSRWEILDAKPTCVLRGPYTFCPLSVFTLEIEHYFPVYMTLFFSEQISFQKMRASYMVILVFCQTCVFVFQRLLFLCSFFNRAEFSFFLQISEPHAGVEPAPITYRNQA